MGDVSEFSGTGENACEESESELERLEAALALFEGGHRASQEVTEAMPLEETRESQEASAAGYLLVGEADLDGFIRGFESNELGHRLVSRCVGGLGGFFHYSPSLHQTVAFLLLHGYG
jgi:hypothetical protein